MNNKYWIINNGVEIGPLTYKDLFKYNLNEESLLWTKDLTVWKELKYFNFCSTYLNSKHKYNENMVSLKKKSKENLIRIIIFSSITLLSAFSFIVSTNFKVKGGYRWADILGGWSIAFFLIGLICSLIFLTVHLLYGLKIRKIKDILL